MAEDDKIESNDKELLTSKTKDSKQAEGEPDFIEHLPEEDREPMRRLYQMTQIHGMSPSPYVQKLNETHLTQILENADQKDIRDRKDRTFDRWFNLAYLLIGCIVFVFLIIYLIDKPEILYNTLIGIVSFLGGYGIGKSRRKNKY